jgi:ATP-dependent Clp protease adaptor protein ClpS
MTSTITRPREKEEQKTQGQPPYNVVLLDDDEHSYEYVIHML